MNTLSPTSDLASPLNPEELALLSRPVPRYTSYPPIPAWKKNLSEMNLQDELVNLVQTDDTTALYIHIPYCKKLCWYCGCNTAIKKDSAHADPYLSALLKEIELWSHKVDQKIKINAIHLGGGTPNFLSSEQFTVLFEAIRKDFDCLDDCDISIECDPRTVTTEQLDTLVEIGCRRISLGIQDFNPKVQEAVNRIQSYDMICKLVGEIRQRPFDSINFDLIAGLPFQSEASFHETLDLTISLKPDRIAIFNFAYMPESRPHMKLIKTEDLPSSDEKLKIFLASRQAFTSNGYHAIGMDHFALNSDPLAQSAKEGQLHRNFMGYTTQSSPNVLGLGASSISRIGNAFWQNPRDSKTYKEQIATGSLDMITSHLLNSEDREKEYIIQELCCNLELNFSKFNELFANDFVKKYTQEMAQMNQVAPERFIEIDEHGIHIAPMGALFIRLIASCFDARSQGGPMSKSL